ncbi:MBL fold metallo-hydrolase [Leucobacter sp.]
MTEASATPPLPPVTGIASWYRTEEERPGLIRITERFVDEFLQANLWLVRGEERAILVDCGLGIVPLLPLVRRLAGGDCPVVLSHGHLDHAGAAHEFAERWGHGADDPRTERRLSLLTAEHRGDLGLPKDGIDGAGDWLLSGIPRPGYDPRAYRQRAAPLTRRLRDGERIDLGGTVLEVLHLPGHTPGSLALYDRDRGELYSGDVVYDDVLLDSLPESDPPAYERSLRRLRGIPVERVLPGHGATFGRTRLHEIIDAYSAAASPRPSAAGPSVTSTAN